MITWSYILEAGFAKLEADLITLEKSCESLLVVVTKENHTELLKKVNEVLSILPK